MSRYRDKLQIVADILSVVSKGAKKTWIMYQANLSYKLLCRYLDEVLDAGLVICEEENSYVLTAKGREFLIRHDEYSTRCEGLTKHLNRINNEKEFLEGMCLNLGSLNRQSNKKRGDKE